MISFIKKAVKSNDVHRSNVCWEKYRESRNYVTKLIRQAKLEYYENVSNQHSKNPKKLWKEVSNVFPKSSNSFQNDISVDKFNEYFASIGTKVAESITEDGEYTSTLPESIHTFTFECINQNFILKMLKSLPMSSKNDVLSFDTKLLNISSHIISTSLTFLLNTSLEIGYCPREWKLAQVSPAFKGKGNPLEETNYRPLSVISHLAKLCEKSVQLQLLKYLMTHKFISIDQFAYLKRHSTQMCLHRLVDDILENINYKEITVLFFLDMRNVLMRSMI